MNVSRPQTQALATILIGMRTTHDPDSPRYEDPLRDSSITFPADEVLWGVAVRPGFDELDDPYYHRGLTQHAYLAGNDNVALCGVRPPLSGPRNRRRPRLSLPSAGVNPMCGTCARRVVAPRTRVALPVQPGRPTVAVPIQQGAPLRPMPVGAGVTPRTFAPGVAGGASLNGRPDQRASVPPAPQAAQGGPAAPQVGPAAVAPAAPPTSTGSEAHPPAPAREPAAAPPAPGVPPVSPWVRRATTGPSGGDPQGR